jgi:glycosyltransferase involved in cell wall biosynthesis
MSKGHEVKAVTRYPENYEYEGIEVYSQKKDYKVCHNNLWDWADLVFCQLSGTYYAMNKQRLNAKKVINFAHNNAGYPQVNIRKNVFTVYNSEQTKKELNYLQETYVLYPPVNYRDFENVDTTKAEYITLINHNENKGGQILIEIAKRMPHHKFMAVQGGYYHQIVDAKAKNIKYVGITDDIRKYLAMTKLLISPSDYDSYGMAQIEALCCNIPVIASDIPGFRESLSDSAIFVKRNDIDAWVEAIKNSEQLFKNKKPIERAKELDPVKELAKFEKWLIKISNLAIK